MIELATRYGRYGYRRITGLLHGEGWTVNHKRVERLWRREGLKVPQKQPKRGRLWLADGSCVRRRPEYRHHVWAYDFVAERTHDGRPLKILTVVDEYSRECLAIVVARRLRSIDVLETLAELFVPHGLPAHIRSDNGPEFTAELVRLWLEALAVETLFIEAGSPWENGYVESFNGKLRDELLDRAIWGHDETTELQREDGRSFVKRRRIDSRLGLAMLARLDRMVETRARAGEEMLAQIVAGDWPGFLMLFDAAEAARAAETLVEPRRDRSVRFPVR